MKDLIIRIKQLLKEKRAVLLAHNYQPPEIQDLADLCGDSLELSIKASQTDAEVVVFCGVHFMAETASVLCPDKTILLPVVGAGCPMADMIRAAELRKRRAELSNVEVISYVNTTADVKAESDICCTSANVVQVVNAVDPDLTLLMTPDRNLARYAIRETGRDILYWDGYCPVHDQLKASRVEKVKETHPDAPFMAHPECRPEVLDLADEIKSTSGMISFARASDHEQFIVGTEIGILHALSKACPNKVFYAADPTMTCPDMKKIGLSDIQRALEEMKPEVRIPEDIRTRAKRAVDRMLAVPRD